MPVPDTCKKHRHRTMSCPPRVQPHKADTGKPQSL